MTHTPGPWDSIGLQVWTAGSVVAECNWISGQITDEEAMANARLVAAAPEMYAVLKELINLPRNGLLAMTSSQQRRFFSALILAHTVFAKIEVTSSNRDAE